MANGTVRVEIDGHIAVMTVSRPEKRNALDLDMLGSLMASADEVEADNAVRVVILTCLLYTSPSPRD